MGLVRIKVEAWLEMSDDIPVRNGSRVDKARNISLGELSRCLGEMLSTKDVKVRHLEALHLVADVD